MHFEKESAVHKTLRAITRRLDELHIPYALAGAMAMFLHGYRRFTEDVDLLVTREGLAALHRDLTGRGYVPLFEASRNLRDAETGVRVEFLVAGEFPGDGKLKPVAFPEPMQASSQLDGIRCLTLESLIELKLASGLSPGRRKDLGDVQELIRAFGLPIEFSQRLNPFVRPTFQELWQELQEAGT